MLKVHSNSGPGGTIKGFTCRGHATHTRNVDDLICTDRSRRITATVHVKR